ncbi:MAG: penicillin-binding protein activator LpoB, partial [Spirochaetaceae bacterium]|nr:penicillin-binding protein activator LpoB [Spirochaetaceae bacterium]
MKNTLFIVVISAALLAACKSPAPAPPPIPPAPEPLSRLAVLPLISGDAISDDVEETFAWRLANVPQLQDHYSIVPITPHIRRNIKQEQTYNSAFDAGEEVHADYVMVTFVKSIGYQWIFYIVIMDVKTRELITGDYGKFDFLEDIPQQFPSMVKKMMSVVDQKKQKNWETQKLAIDMLQMPSIENVNSDAPVILTQLLANEMANSGKFRVFPRTDNIDAAALAYEKERTSTNKFLIIDRNDLIAADFVLSCKISSLTTPPLPPFEMLGEIIAIDSNRLLIGSHVS